MNFKKFTAIAVVGLTLVAALIGCADQKKEDNTFTVGFDQDFPPFGYVDEDDNYYFGTYPNAKLIKYDKIINEVFRK